MRESGVRAINSTWLVTARRLTSGLPVSQRTTYESNLSETAIQRGLCKIAIAFPLRII